MRYLLMVAFTCLLVACSDNNATEAPENKATDLRDWAQGHTGRAELTAQIAEAKMTLRLLEQNDPQGAGAKELRVKIENLNQQLKALEQKARQ